MRGKRTTLYSSSSACSRRGEGLVARKNAKEFQFDHCYWSVDVSDNHYANQEQVYSDLGVPVVEAALAGYNSCVFAYGQTGSGKTYTMAGCSSEPGLTPRICEVSSLPLYLSGSSHLSGCVDHRGSFLTSTEGKRGTRLCHTRQSSGQNLPPLC